MCYSILGAGWFHGQPPSGSPHNGVHGVQCTALIAAMSVPTEQPQGNRLAKPGKAASHWHLRTGTPVHPLGRGATLLPLLPLFFLYSSYWFWQWSCRGPSCAHSTCWRYTTCTKLVNTKINRGEVLDKGRRRLVSF